ncbi:unnamed protein product, partial [Sphagnum tenellum]
LGSHHFIKQIKEIIKSLGLVFGDIGTSPLYTLSVVFFLIKPTQQNILGVLSLIVWTLILLVSMQYVWLTMSLGKKGEGGTIVLKELLIPLLGKSTGQISFVTILSFIGIALFFGDGVVTPAMSVLSAIEGVLFIPGCQGLSRVYLLIIACIITILLFFFQHKGTERVSAAFGPLMLVWFLSMATSGSLAIIQQPFILYALNPYYAYKFFVNNGITSFFALSGVILCATGGEALYADMGHLGRKHIVRAWYFVFIALVLTYLGQGAFLLENPHVTKSFLYEMFLSQQPFFFVPFLVLSICATVVASQAMISGIFSVVYQGIVTNILPMFKVDYTSSKLRSQVYIGTINWLLMTAVLFIILQFKYSYSLAVVYGLAVTGTMTVTGIMTTWIFWLRRVWHKALIGACLTMVSSVFFMSNICKISAGGYWSLMIALFPLTLILVYTSGQRKLLSSLQPMPMETFLPTYEHFYNQTTKIKGTALYFVRDIRSVQSYVTQVMFKNNILYEDNILISVITRDDPFGIIGFFKGDLGTGFRVFEIHMGYMEVLDIEKILHNAGIDATVIFYGLEQIVTKNIVWKVFSLILRISPSFVQFYKLPPYKLHGVVTSVEM